MENRDVIDRIKLTTDRLKGEMNRIPNAKVLYKWYINGELSRGGAEEVDPKSIEEFISHWVGQGFFLEQKTQEAKSIIWLKIWEYGDPEPSWDEVFE